MAKSGYTSVLVQEVFGSRTYLHFFWQVTSTSVYDNTSTVEWKLSFRGENDGFYIFDHVLPYTVIINGEKFTGNSSLHLEMNGNKTLAQGSVTIPHDPNGAKTFSYSFYQTFWDLRNFEISGEGTGVLDRLNRQIILNSVSNFNDESNPTFQFTVPNTKNIESVQACISLTGEADNVPYREIPYQIGVTQSATFVLTDAERATLRKAVTSGNNTTVRFYLRSIVEGVTYLWYKIVTFSLVNYLPTLSPTVKDINARAVSLTGNDQTFIRYFSNAQFTTGAVVKKEATIASQYVTCGSTTLNTSTGTIEEVDSNTYYFGVTDNRGHTAQRALVKTLIPYVKPTCSIKSIELNANGHLTFTIAGKYFNGSFGTTNNTFELDYSMQEEGGDIVWYRTGALTPTVDSNNNYEITYVAQKKDELDSEGRRVTTEDGNKVFAYRSRYDFQVYVIDAITNSQTFSTVLATIPVFDWGSDDFKHYTDVHIDHNKSIVGTRADGATFRAIEPCNGSGHTVINWDSYEQSRSDTEIYGNNVKITARDTVYINGKEYGKNKMLWQGSLVMNQNESIELPERIYDQNSGIVLVFSRIDDNGYPTLYSSVNTFFVSKGEVSIIPNAAHTFIMGINAGFSEIGAKYIYISDRKLSGHTGNDDAGTNSGITFNNARYALCFVFGV